MQPRLRRPRRTDVRLCKQTEHGAVFISEFKGKYAASVCVRNRSSCGTLFREAQLHTRLAAAAAAQEGIRRPPSKAFVTKEQRERQKASEKSRTRHELTFEEVSAEVTGNRTLCSGFGLEQVTASKPAVMTAPFLARAT